MYGGPRLQPSAGGYPESRWVCQRYNRQKKGAQPLRVVGRQKRVIFARVPGGKPARANHIFG
jgi:hypothetical protein